MSSAFAFAHRLVWGVLVVPVLTSVTLAVPTPPSHSCPGAVNAILGDESFFWATGQFPDTRAGEDLRIGIHLAYVEALLRSRDVSDLPAAAREAREHNLDRLHEYRIAGSFPRHERCPRGRKPVFIDHEGRICAVGYLVEQSAGRTLAAAIDSRFHESSIAEMESQALAKWAASSGLTALELAMIQPCYGCPPTGECLKLSGRAWTTPEFPGDSLTLVAVIDIPASAMLHDLQIDGEITLHVAATFSHYSGWGDWDNYHYDLCRINIFEDSSSPAIYSPSPPNPVTPATFQDGEAFLTGSGWFVIVHNRRYESLYWEGNFNIEKGSHYGELEDPYVHVSGSLHPMNDDGYQFTLEDAAVIGACFGPAQTVETTSWGRIKAAYR